MEYSEIIAEFGKPVSVLTLNSPKTVNALSEKMIAELTNAFETIGADPNVSVIILKAAGKHFCAGHYLREMVDASMPESKAIFENCSKMMQMIQNIPQVVIAQIHGVATAAGCQVAATCDLAVCDETARFGTPGVRIGLFCTTPMVALSRAVGRKRAMEMLMTGRLISAHEAENWGLVNKIVPEAELNSAVMEMAQSIAEASPFTLALGKKAFYKQIELDTPRAYDYANQVITLNLMSEDAQEGIKAFLEKRKPTWKGC